MNPISTSGSGLLFRTEAGAAEVPVNVLCQAFAALQYRSINWLHELRYHGVPISKHPVDLHTYQELIWMVQPTVIIETGSWCGGSALFFADHLQRLHGSQPWLVVSVDNGELAHDQGLDLPQFVEHERIVFLHGCSWETTTIERIRAYIRSVDRVLVSLDGAHEEADVEKELTVYAPFVTVGSYLVVEDTNAEHLFYRGTNKGPAGALKSFLALHHEFQVDYDCERFLITFNPGGWLKRVAC